MYNFEKNFDKKVLDNLCDLVKKDIKNNKHITLKELMERYNINIEYAKMILKNIKRDID